MTDIDALGFGIFLIGVVAFVTIRAIIATMRDGASRITEVREEGGGLVAKLRGELIGGQRRSSSSRAHGLHMTVLANGQLSVIEKSVISDEVL